MSIAVVYWSGTGNTQAMAEAVARGITKAGAEAELLFVDQADPAKTAVGSTFALGCPSMGAEELEGLEMEPFVQVLEGLISGKKVFLFGSYGWGDGEWMRTWEERMKAAGAELIGGQGVIANEAPDEEALAACEKAGETLVKAAE